jgi:hypothetical protein
MAPMVIFTPHLVRPNIKFSQGFGPPHALFWSSQEVGFVDPLERDTASVVDDVAEGLVSREAAYRDYGLDD